MQKDYAVKKDFITADDCLKEAEHHEVRTLEVVWSWDIPSNSPTLIAQRAER